MPHERFNTDGSDPREAEAKRKLEAAIEELMSVTHGEQLMLTGYLMQAVASSVDGSDSLTFTAKEGQSGITTMGLSAYLEANVSIGVFGEDD